MKLSQRLSCFFAEMATRFGLVLVYLFGSQVQGRPGPRSDYDFAVLFEDEPSLRERSALIHQLVQLLGTDHVDLVVLRRAPIELKYNVIAMGSLLYEVDRAQRVEFEAQTLSRYFDYLPILRRQRAELIGEEEKGYEAGIQRYRTALRKTQAVLAQARTA